MNFDDVALQVKRARYRRGYVPARDAWRTWRSQLYILYRIDLNLTEQRCNKLKRNYELYDYLWKTDLNEMFSQFLETAIEEIKPEATLTVASGEELPPPTSPSRRRGSTSSCSRRRFSCIQGVQHEVDDMKPTHEIDFLRIQSQPVKQALSTWCNKWMYCFTNYLQEKLMDDLTGVYDFMDAVDIGLDQEVEDGDKETLMSVMSHIRDVRQRMGMEAELRAAARDGGIAQVQRIELDLGISRRTTTLWTFLERAPFIWDNTVNKTFRVKESIQPLQNAMVDFIKRDIADYVSRTNSHIVKNSGTRSTGPSPGRWDRIKDAYESMDKTYEKMKVLEAEARQFGDLQELFELNKIKAPELVTLRTELKLLKQVWDCVGVVESLSRLGR